MQHSTTQRQVGVALVGLALLLAAQAAAAADGYHVRFDRSEWRLQASALECRLWQNIPNFGDAVFTQKAGESAGFELASHRTMPAGDALIRIEAPAWRRNVDPGELGTVPVRNSRTPVTLGYELSEKLLSALDQGLNPVFDHLQADTLTGRASVGLAAANFKQAYTDYDDCRDRLIPATYADVSRTRVPYGAGGWEVSEEGMHLLDLVVRHIEADPSISHIFVDGYTDASGKRSTNLELSKKRAEAVVSYLVSNGIPLERITMRYHGSRYPVANGFSAAARAKNRRVTVRLERGGTFAAADTHEADDAAN